MYENGSPVAASVAAQERKKMSQEIDEEGRQAKKCDSINFILKINFKMDLSDMLICKSRRFIHRSV